ncbi:mRNA interferase MazF [Enterococcus casseliflavus]|uniref:type II toxin-antitoxin system PemK/MazF family toxin n=1 Tax=Enterococcus TaxID=1350 RepID=UPI0008E8E6B4|nr:type II toxin-antitoxin system PemK/MazF family toxin [Enterococcus casseliflavus]SFD70519.1 mRNA interferase MazF [Enterococcus casseliflavus]
MVRQEDIIEINLEHKERHEQQDYRPYTCLSFKGIIQFSNIAVFCAISNTKRNYPLYVPLKDKQTIGKVLLDRLVTIDFNAQKYRYVEILSEKPTR